MTMVATSPATEGTSRRATTRPSPATSALASFGIPRGPEEAEKLLHHAEKLVRDRRITAEQVEDLARFLGANSAAWTRPNRERLHRVLVQMGGGIIQALVSAMARLPRTDVLDECEVVLGALPKVAVPEMRRLIIEERGRLAGSIRAVLLSAAIRVDSASTVQMLLATINDQDAEIRETAARLLGEVGGIDARGVLEGRLRRETDSAVTAAIREAIDSLEA